jgi:D-alanyl-D-alanine carboxypeptidase
MEFTIFRSSRCPANCAALRLDASRLTAAIAALGISCNAAATDALPVKAALDRLIARGETPGLQYMFVSADAVLFSYSAGIANPAEGVPVSDGTTFNAYSVTKTFTAAAVLQLAQAGKLELDKPISLYLNHFPYAQSPTVRQTLTHTGGFPNPNPMAWVHLADEHAAFDKPQFVDTVLRANSTLKSAPGKSYAYSNVGYLLLGEAIEKVAGQAYTATVEQQLIRPLRLLEGETLAFTIERPGSHARGTVERWSLLNLVLDWFIDRDRFVDARSSRWVQLRNLYVNGAAYGGLIGNARGLSRYLQALLGRDDYLSARSRALLFTPAPGPGGSDLPRSLGWFTGQLGGETYYTHAGGAAGYYCELRVYPGIGRASVVMFNRTGIRDERALDAIDAFFLTDRPTQP